MLWPRKKIKRKKLCNIRVFNRIFDLFQNKIKTKCTAFLETCSPGHDWVLTLRSQAIRELLTFRCVIPASKAGFCHLHGCQIPRHLWTQQSLAPWGPTTCCSHPKLLCPGFGSSYTSCPCLDCSLCLTQLISGWLLHLSGDLLGFCLRALTPLLSSVSANFQPFPWDWTHQHSDVFRTPLAQEYSPTRRKGSAERMSTLPTQPVMIKRPVLRDCINANYVLFLN